MATGSKWVVLALSMALAGTASAAEAPRSSWGRAGVGFDQYRADAVECGHAGLGTDIADLKAVRTLAAASQQIDTLLQNQQSAMTPDGMIDTAALNTAQQVARTVEGANPRARFREVRAVLMTTVEQCLTGKGYQRFDLTSEQRKQLGRLKAGSAERHAYLHALASDPDILARQSPTVTVQPAP